MGTLVTYLTKPCKIPHKILKHFCKILHKNASACPELCMNLIRLFKLLKIFNFSN